MCYRPFYESFMLFIFAVETAFYEYVVFSFFNYTPLRLLWYLRAPVWSQHYVNGTQVLKNERCLCTYRLWSSGPSGCCEAWYFKSKSVDLCDCDSLGLLYLDICRLSSYNDWDCLCHLKKAQVTTYFLSIIGHKRVNQTYRL